MAAAAVGLAALGCVPATSAQAASWRTPVTLSEPAPVASVPAIGFGSRGHGLAVWGTRPEDASAVVGLAAAERSPGGRWSPATDNGLFGGEFVARAVTRRRAVLLLETAVPGSHPSGTDPVMLRTVEIEGPEPATGAATAAEVDPGHPVERFSGSLAASRGGRLLVAWTRAERRDRGVYARFGAAGGALEPVERLAHAGLALAAGVNERGDAAVVWAEEDGRLKARVRPAGDEFGPRQDIGDFETEYFDNDAGFGEASLAVGPSGQVVVGWTFDTLRDTGEEVGEPQFQDFFAAAAPRRGEFGKRRHLQRSKYTDDTSVEALVTSRGLPLVAWGGGGVKYAVAANDRFGPREVLAASGDSLAAATGPRGTAGLVWLHGSEETARSLRASLLSPSRRTFGRPERIRAGGAGPPLVRDPALAFDPRRGRPTAVWVARGSPGDVVRASERR